MACECPKSCFCNTFNYSVKVDLITGKKDVNDFVLLMREWYRIRLYSGDYQDCFCDCFLEQVEPLPYQLEMVALRIWPPFNIEFVQNQTDEMKYLAVGLHRNCLKYSKEKPD
eukprot:NODE_32_length_32166_cov_0.707737.p21 type:complete len:112 gc:universal NODE_32_length_32166_cov_0.707737:5278-4943(-)